MLNALSAVLASGALGQGVLLNAVLESFTIHVRAVMDFLYADNPRPDDVIAEDFLPENTQWSTLRPALTPELIAAKSRAGKEIAHLTYARFAVTPKAKPWQFVRITEDISNAFQVFRGYVQRERLDERWYQ